MPWVGSHSDQDYFQWNGFGCFHKLRKWDYGIQGMKPWYTVCIMDLVLKYWRKNQNQVEHFRSLFNNFLDSCCTYKNWLKNQI